MSGLTSEIDTWYKTSLEQWKHQRNHYDRYEEIANMAQNKKELLAVLEACVLFCTEKRS